MQVALNAQSGTDVPDDVLVGRSIAGDAGAFETIMRRNNRRLYRAVRGILRNDSDAEEAVQDAYLVAYRSLASFRGESRLSTWLMRIAINTALQATRRKKREENIVPTGNVIDLDAYSADQSLLGTTETPEASAMRAEMRGVLERKIDTLPAPYRTVFILRAVEDMSMEEIAETLGVPAPTVRTRFFRAKRLLRQSLSADMDAVTRQAYMFDGVRCDRIVTTVLSRIFPSRS